MMRKEDGGEIRPIDELLAAYPDIFVERDQIGFFNIYRKLTPTARRTIGVSVMQNIHINPTPEVHISGHVFTEQELKEETRTKVVSITPETNPNTYLIIKRPSNSRLQAEVIYPRDETKRIDYGELLEDAMHGLEIFDAFSQLSPEERERYRDRVVDEMADFDVAQYREIMRAVDQSTGGNLEAFAMEIGFDAGLIKGQPKFALLLMHQVKDLPISSITVSGTQNN